MTPFAVLDVMLVALVVTAAVLVVRIRSLVGSVLALSLLGIALTVLFVLLGAPDVAHAEIVVGAIALPVLFLLAIGKCRTVVESRQEFGDTTTADTTTADTEDPQQQTGGDR